MGLRLFNTLSRQTEVFEPLDAEGKSVSLYCCGPTVHDFAHIGNFRTFVLTDLLCRYLRFLGYEVTYVMNVTDVEDKIIARVREARATLKDYTTEFEGAFFEDMDALGCVRPDKVPHATEYVSAIIELILKLVEKGIAYITVDGSVYFSIKKYQSLGCVYGQLTKLDFEQMRPGERVSNDKYEKDAIADFALWKARVPEDGEVFWPSPWGEGRPGWHIECSAMSMKLLGPSFDLHLGGEDLVFPHHEDEIAQSEGAGLQKAGGKFVRYWVHGAHLLVEGKKMSKSLGNFFTLRDLMDRGFTGREVRFVLTSAHYRETFNFTLDGLRGGKSALNRIDECVGKLSELAREVTAEPSATFLDAFREALDDDLNVSLGWSVVFDWVREMNRHLSEGGMTSEAAAANLAAWKRVDAVLGVGSGATSEVLAEVTALMEERQVARKVRDFQRADAIRDELLAAGWTIEDTPKGPRVKRA
ncbi:MAG: Cysteine--tRNA ligase [Verrucomicrobia subdivision 3 bacterium]|nr:Cysteine--tRNA ligase [Limisphaerales bacterium]MCS1416025.1 Cysteine--tRNA ligase [Limisphaerales bacterium]